MKRIYFLFACMLAAIASHAQIVTTTSSFQKIEKAHKTHYPCKFEFYGKVGLNLMTASVEHSYFDDELLSAQPKVGFDLNLGFICHFRPSHPSNFYWGMELGLTQVGSSYKSHTADSYTPGHRRTERIKSHQNIGVILSPSFGWKKGISNDISIDVHINPGVLFNPRYVEMESHVVYYKDGTLNGSNDNFDEVKKKWFLSIKSGIGVWYNRWNIDFSYRRSTSDHIDFSNYIISLGYRF